MACFAARFGWYHLFRQPLAYVVCYPESNASQYLLITAEQTSFGPSYSHYLQKHNIRPPLAHMVFFLVSYGVLQQVVIGSSFYFS